MAGNTDGGPGTTWTGNYMDNNLSTVTQPVYPCERAGGAGWRGSRLVSSVRVSPQSRLSTAGAWAEAAESFPPPDVAG